MTASLPTSPSAPLAASPAPSPVGRPRGYLVVPVTGGPPVLAESGAARQLLRAAQALLKPVLDGPVEVLLVDARQRRLWSFEDGAPLPLPIPRLPVPHGKPAGVAVFMNPGVLRLTPLPLAGLLDAAASHGAAWCGWRSCRDLYALAVDAGGGGLAEEPMWRALAFLTACADDRPSGNGGGNGGGDDAEQSPAEHEWESLAGLPFVPPAPSGVEFSPLMRDRPDARRPRWADSPHFLNTALLELIVRPQSDVPVWSNPRRMAEVLSAHRKVSRVPWVFNALLTEIDVRLGSVYPRSFPPEIHLSVTGRCNIECRFCVYTHDHDRGNFVSAQDMAKLDFLPNLQSIRLSSGIGEPALNKHLPDIIADLTARHPHIGINLFTNGMALHRPGLIDAMVGTVRWVNVSLNASTRESWKEQCQVDGFERVCRNLRQIAEAKRARGTLWPLMCASMVLTSASLADLPRMPALCRELGIDRFTAFPFFGLGYNNHPDKYADAMTLAAHRDQYDVLYQETMRNAELHEVTVELPAPSAGMMVEFGLEARPLQDFAHIESNDWTLGRFVDWMIFDKPEESYCRFLWRQGAISATHNKSGHDSDETHYMYPCLGPLSGVNLSRSAAFRFPDSDGFMKLWQGRVFSHLRRAQHARGVCEVCDFCRNHDTRDPQGFAHMERVVAQYAEAFGDPPGN